MRYVLDSCVALKWVLPEKDSPKAVRLRNDFREHIHELMAPDIFAVEIAHALSRAERKRLIRPPQGMKRLIAVMRFPPVLYAYLPLIPRAFAISSAMGVGVYDCLYVALAERERCSLVTADEKLAKALQRHFPFITALQNLS
jgi:predicted nucleic acid-binding protein